MLQAALAARWSEAMTDQHVALLFRWQKHGPVYSVPEAILKLRQGIGRLIRNQKDKGIAVILDNRVLTKHYGKQFLKALPNAPRVIV